MKNRIVTIFGGSGFVGTHVVRELVRKGFLIRVVSRNPNLALHLKTNGFTGQVSLEAGNINHEEDVERFTKDSYAVVNLVGVLFSKGRQNFSAVHAQGAEKLAKAAKHNNVHRFIHISALGVDKASKSMYARSKVNGEKAVHKAFSEAVILRPSVIFGADDDFTNKFSRMAQIFHVLPLIGGGKTLFQPVYVSDVAKAVSAICEDETAAAKTYELVGPDIISFKEILEYIVKITGVECHYINMPSGIAKVAGFFNELLPKPMITRDQVRLLEYDNIASNELPTLISPGITPTSLYSALPEYLGKYKPDN